MNAGHENVDRGETAKFDRLASRWWDPDGESRPLHDLNPVRFAYVAERVALRGARVLDVGCGLGGFLRFLRDETGAESYVTRLDGPRSWVVEEHRVETGKDVFREGDAGDASGKTLAELESELDHRFRRVNDDPIQCQIREAIRLQLRTTHGVADNQEAPPTI